jgi:T4 bacteriophage base plate protein
MSSNPLAHYFRSPKLYVSLPSQGIFYPSNSINTSINGELAIYALTTIDQMMLKTPDALLNGEALLQIVKSCAPGITDVKQLVEPDINTILLALRIASNGPTIEVPVPCPECKHENNFVVDLQPFLDTQTLLDPQDCELYMNETLKISLRPYDFEQRNLTLLNEVDQVQRLKILGEREYEHEPDRMREIGQFIQTMAQRTFQVVARSIVSVHILDGNITVSDSEHIAEWLRSIDKSQADIIIGKIKELNQVGINTTTNFQCESCNHEWQHDIDLSPISFFD